MCINIVTPIASDADMNSNGTQSRANDGYEAGISLENYIDVAGGDFRIYIFRADASDGNDTYVGCFEPEDVQTVAFSGYLNYRVMGPAPETLLNLGGNFKLMVAANWKTYPGNTELTPELPPSTTSASVSGLNMASLAVTAQAEEISV